jgi:hypothetical protein
MPNKKAEAQRSGFFMPYNLCKGNYPFFKELHDIHCLGKLGNYKRQYKPEKWPCVREIEHQADYN